MTTRVRRLVVAAIVVLLLVGAGLLARSLWKQRQVGLQQRALDLLPYVAQRIKNFHRVKVVDGRKVWEVAAREARYFDETEMVVVQEPVVSVFLADGRVVSLRGSEGTVYLGGRDLKGVKLAGNIDVQFGDYALHTESVHYEADRGVIIVPGRVQISGAVFDIQGEQMEVEVSSQRFTVSRDVQMMLWPNE